MRTDWPGVLILSPGQNADNHVQAHSEASCQAGLTVVAETPAQAADERKGQSDPCTMLPLRAHAGSEADCHIERGKVS